MLTRSRDAQAIPDVVAGGIGFAARGTHELEGIPAVVADGHVVDTFDLSSPTTRFKRVLIVDLASPITGDVQVRITSSDQRVEIDALGISQR